jgi:Tol biopolymer transport system component
MQNSSRQPTLLPRIPYLAILASLWLAVSTLHAQTGTLNLSVRDVTTHYAVQARVRLQGPEQVSIQTDDQGKASVLLTPGEYRIEVSSVEHQTLRTHYLVGSGQNLPFTVMLAPVNQPSEETREALDPDIRPKFTLLHGYVVDGETGKALSHVKVSFLDAGVSAYTDANGHYLLSVPTPEPENPGGMGTDTLTYRKEGYKTLTFTNFGVAGEEMGGSGIELEKGSQTITQDATHKLLKKDGQATEEPQSARPGKQVPTDLYAWLAASGTAIPVGTNNNLATSSAIVIPISIRVGTGGSSTTSYQPCASKSTCTNVMTFPLESYVTQGLPGEWLASWYTDSQKAGAVAYRSFGAWFVAHPLTSSYDICNTTSCQNYNPWKAPPNTTSKAAVAATTSVVLSSNNADIFFAEYAAESNLASDTKYATCPDGQVGEPAMNWPCMTDSIDIGKSQSGTHSRGMCQRGSQRWASGKDMTGAPGDTGATVATPRDWRCILDHYYNASSNSITVDPTGAGSPGAGSGLRIAFTHGEPTYGSVAYEAFPARGTGLGTLRAFNAADGSGDHQILSFANGSTVEPTWSPGGKRVAFWSAGGIWVVNADGTGLQNITSPTGNDQYGNTIFDTSPAWSPLGDKIAFCSTRSGTNVDIWTVNPDGTGLANLTNNSPVLNYIASSNGGFEGCSPGWSPDGKQIVFTGVTAYVPYPGTGTSWNVYTMNANGTNLTQRTNCQANNIQDSIQSLCGTPSWSPDGSSIAFFDVNTTSGDNYGGGGIYKYIYSPTGATLMPLFQDQTSTNWHPRFSTDGQKIIFGSSYGGAGLGIWSMNADGSGRVEILPGGKNGVPQDSLDCSRCARFDILNTN